MFLEDPQVLTTQNGGMDNFPVRLNNQLTRLSLWVNPRQNSRRMQVMLH